MYILILDKDCISCAFEKIPSLFSFFMHDDFMSEWNVKKGFFEIGIALIISWNENFLLIQFFLF